MPQEFQSEFEPQTEAFAARQTVTPEEVQAALSALDEQEARAPGGTLSIGQVLDELDLTLPAADVWREVQKQRQQTEQKQSEAQALSADAVTQTAAPPARRPRRKAAVAALAAAVLAAGGFLVKHFLDGPSVSVTTSSSTQNNNSTQNNSGVHVTRRDGTTVTVSPSGTVNINRPVASQTTPPAQTVNPPAVRPKTLLPPDTVSYGANEVRTITGTGGRVIVGGGSNSLTVTGRLDLLVVNGEGNTLRLRGPVRLVVIGGAHNTLTYPAALPAPRIVDNGANNTVRAR